MRNGMDELPDLQVLRRCWPEYSDLDTTHHITVHGITIGGSASPCASPGRSA